jgi:hypothetical protein
LSSSGRAHRVVNALGIPPAHVTFGRPQASILKRALEIGIFSS